MKKMIQEFKKFAVRGNVIDLAVGIIIGGAFGKITSSLVNDVIMPPIGVLIGGVDFTELSVTLKPEYINEVGDVISAVSLRYGLFINTIIDFVIIAFAVFMMVRVINRLQKEKEEPKKEEKPKGPTEIELLTEIRDTLKKNNKA